MNWEEEFDKEFEKALVRVAKEFIKRSDSNTFNILKKFVEEKDVYAVCVISLISGISHGSLQTPFATAIVLNFKAIITKLRNGVSEEEILKELELLRKEQRIDNFKTFGGVA